MHPEPGSNHERTAPTVTAWLRVALVTLCLPVHGCDMGTGGAVELSWKLRPASSGLAEKFVECESMQNGTGRVQKIRLRWTAPSGRCDPPEKCIQDWECDDSHGATGFELPTGSTELSIEPLCAPVPGMPELWAADPATYIAPATLQRDVIAGQTVSLGAVELVVSVSSCITAPVDSRNAGTSACICCKEREQCRL